MSQQEKELSFLGSQGRYIAKQNGFNEIPGVPVAYWISNRTLEAFESKQLLKDFVTASVGIQTGDNERFLHFWWEIKNSDVMYNARNVQDSFQEKKWFPYNKGGEFRKWAGNDTTVIDWRNDGENIKKNSQISGHHYQQYSDVLKFKPLITWSRITTGTPAFRLKASGYLSDMAGFSLYADESCLKAIIAFCNSVVAKHYLDFLAPTLNIMVGSVISMPFSLPALRVDYINRNVDSAMLCSQAEWDSFENSWNFQRHPLLPKLPLGSECVFQDASGKMGSITMTSIALSEEFARWENECNERFNQLKSNEEELNRIFIDIYGLQDELTPEVEDKDVTVRRADLGRDIRSFISYAVGCMFGRYSLDEPGLVYAGGEWSADKYKTFPADKDNIIPICDDEYFEDDIVGRFVKFVETVYGSETLDENLKFIAGALGGKGQPKDVIRNYFLNDFYNDHCRIYQKRPIYWQFDSGKKNGFKCLIYMHRYQPDTIARIRTDYVHEQQSRYRTAIEDLEQRIASAATSERVKLNKKLKTIQDQASELHTYEEKIHHLADQMIPIDLDDGVKVNYAKFQDVLAKIK